MKVINAEACGCVRTNPDFSGPPEELDFAEGSTCGMPVEWRLHVLETRLEREFGDEFLLEAVGLYGVSPSEQSAALEAIVETGAAFPVVLVNGVVACTGDIEFDAIASRVAASLVAP